MASIYTVWTTKGKAMAAEQLGPNNSITFTRVAASSKNYSSTDPVALAALTKLDSEQQKGYIAYSNIINSNTLHMELLFKNSEATKNYNLCAVGLYATGSDKQEYLYSVTVLQNPQVIDPDSAGSTFGLSLNTIVGDATTAKVTITDAGAITQAILDAGLSTKQNLIGYTPADDSKVVHTSDMRKPANDVAGIDEVNTKQDKIGYTPADDSKVIHKDPNSGNTSENVNFTGKAQKDNSDLIVVSDMRKPASDVAGIEEVNAKQDKIAYTPADDSKVLHSTVTQLYSTDMNTVLTAGFYQLIGGTNGIPSGDNWTIYQVIPINSQNGVQVAYETNNAISGMRSWDYTKSGLTFTSWVLNADDSKVAHLSGANNFDTVPTVNNNPLLLASGLPSDLARLSHDANFTAKLQQNGQDVALANNTLARNPDNGQATQKINFASGDLTTDGYPIMAYGVATDKNDATAKSAKYPGVLFMW